VKHGSCGGGAAAAAAATRRAHWSSRAGRRRGATITTEFQNGGAARRPAIVSCRRQCDVIACISMKKPGFADRKSWILVRLSRCLQNCEILDK